MKDNLGAAANHPSGILRTLEEFGFEFPDEGGCTRHFRDLRWRAGLRCPYCGETKIYGELGARQNKCSRCRRTFSVKVGSIFQGSPIPLRRWFAAIWFATQRDTGVTSSEFARAVGISQNSSWRMLRHLRLAASTASFWETTPVRQPIEAKATWQFYERPRRRNEKRFRLNLTFEEALARFTSVKLEQLRSISDSELRPGHALPR